jgi:hypothetical protein
VRTSLNPGQRLLWFIDAVLMEERKFVAWNRAQFQDLDQLDEMHRDGMKYHDGFSGHGSICDRHMAVFQRHRRLHDEHDEISRYCVSLMSKINSSELSNEEIADEIEHLSLLYEQIRLEHNRMEKERQGLIREHEEIVGAPAQHRR